MPNVFSGILYNACYYNYLPVYLFLIFFLTKKEKIFVILNL